MINYGHLLIIHQDEEDGFIQSKPVAIVLGSENLALDITKATRNDDDYKDGSYSIASMPIFTSLKEAEDFYQ